MPRHAGYIASMRTGTIERSTKETAIRVQLDLDGDRAI